ncbi:MAG: hypothetical protein H6816_02565 [Phycisphaerales bacterium]|nr:hypothetical protein [Phycisphaerales bacterium]
MKGTHIAAKYDHDVTAAIDEMKLQTPPHTCGSARTSDEPAEVHHKIANFNRLIEAIVIVVLVSVLFMEWQ